MNIQENIMKCQKWCLNGLRPHQIHKRGKRHKYMNTCHYYALSHQLNLQALFYQIMKLSFKNPRSQVISKHRIVFPRSFQATLALAHAIDYFIANTYKFLSLLFLHWKAKNFFFNYEYDYVVSVGTMCCVDGEGFIAAGLYAHRTNNQCCLVISASYITCWPWEIYKGSGKSAGYSFFCILMDSCKYGRCHKGWEARL
jgi:hypothetical protein